MGCSELSACLLCSFQLATKATSLGAFGILTLPYEAAQFRRCATHRLGELNSRKCCGGSHCHIGAVYVVKIARKGIEVDREMVQARELQRSASCLYVLKYYPAVIRSRLYVSSLGLGTLIVGMDLYQRKLKQWLRIEYLEGLLKLASQVQYVLEKGEACRFDFANVSKLG